MHYSSFKKGDLFENFVVDKLFNGSEYDLIYRTNSFDQNEARFAEYTLKPDFKFRCKKTQKEFYVEAKFRSGFNSDNKIEVISYSQIERFKIYQKEENIPIFIAVGYGNSPENPAYVSLIPLNELTYLELYGSFLRRFDVKKGLINSDSLNLLADRQTVESEGIPEQKIEQSVNNPQPTENLSSYFFKNKWKIIASVIVLVIISFALFNIFNNPDVSNVSNVSKGSINNTLRERIEDYYNTIHSGNMDGLENFINQKVDRWYSRSNVTFEEIKKYV